MTALDTSGRGWAYTGVVLGGAVSIAANVAHSFIPPKGAPQQWSPEAGAVVGAIVWPVFLFVAVEILARVAWPHGRTWRAVRWAGILPVAIVAALVSYRQLSGLLAHYGEEPVVSILGPLAVDGLMVMATGALVATSRHRTTTEVLSAPADAAPGGEPAPTTPQPTVPPSPTDTPAPPAPSPKDAHPTATPAPAPTPEPAPPQTPTPAVLAARITPNRPTDPPGRSDAAPRPAAARKPSPRPHTPAAPPATRLAPSATDAPVTAPDAAQPAPPVVPPGLLAKATTVARQYRTEHGTPITAGQLAVRLKVTTAQAVQVLALADLGPDSPTRPIPTVNGQPVKVTR
jgi:outer membrane biosynthesis protein TonB